MPEVYEPQDTIQNSPTSPFDLQRLPANYRVDLLAIDQHSHEGYYSASLVSTTRRCLQSQSRNLPRANSTECASNSPRDTLTYSSYNERHQLLIDTFESVTFHFH